MTGDSTLTSLNLDNSVISFQAPTARSLFSPKILTVTGNYVGNGGTLMLNTVLGGDDSLTDKLVINGDTSGSTNIAINNVGGAGAEAVEGIEIIQVDGNSNGTFVKSGRIVAGAYDYDLVKKGNNWNLTSELSPENLDLLDPTSPGLVNQYRPEMGSYLANNMAANTLFTSSLHDRLGETQYTDWLTGEQKVTSMWMRTEVGHSYFTDSSDQLNTKTDSNILQIGGDLAQWSSDGLDRLHLGVMGGYASQKSKTANIYNDYNSRGEIEGYSVGLFATWYANNANKTGAYLDGWAQYNWFDNTVQGQDIGTEEYNSNGFTASIEAGYSFLIDEREGKDFWLQPQAQIVWMDVQADTHEESNGTQVHDNSDGNLMTRVGLRMYAQSNDKFGGDLESEYQPFIEANWLHNSDDYAVQMGDIQDQTQGMDDIAEFKVGI